MDVENNMYNIVTQILIFTNNLLIVVNVINMAQNLVKLSVIILAMLMEGSYALVFI